MRRDRPSERKVVDGIGHDRITIALPADRDADAEGIQSVGLVVAEVEFFLEAQRPPFVTGTGANVEAVAKRLLGAEAAKPVLDIIEHGPATLDAKIGSTGPTGHQEQLGLCARPAERHGDRNAGA